MAQLNAWNVPAGLDDARVLRVDNEGATTDVEASASALADTSANGLAVSDVSKVSLEAELAEHVDGGASLEERLGTLGDDEGELRDLRDAVTTGEDEGRESRSSDSRSQCVTLLGDVDTSVPASPGTVGVEHVSSTAHVTKSCLTSSVGSSTRNTGDTRHSSTSTPGLGRSLHTGPTAYTVSLTLVLSHVGVDLSDQIGTEGSSEHSRERERLGITLRRVIELIDRNGGSSGGHFVA